jgi:hypothetical protein
MTMYHANSSHWQYWSELKPRVLTQVVIIIPTVGMACRRLMRIVEKLISGSEEISPENC